MGVIRDIVLTIGVLLLLLAGGVALPVIMVIAIILGITGILGGVGYLIYAYIHDQRITQEEANEKDN